MATKNDESVFLTFKFSSEKAAKQFVSYLNRLITVRDLNTRYHLGGDADPKADAECSRCYGYFTYSDLVLLIDPTRLYRIDPRSLSLFWKTPGFDKIKIETRKPITTVSFPQPSNLGIDFTPIKDYDYTNDDAVLQQQITKRITEDTLFIEQLIDQAKEVVHD